jgi:hypothetical protein
MRPLGAALAALYRNKRAILALTGKPVRFRGGHPMYRVYSGPPGSAMTSPLEKERMLFKGFATLDAALMWARHLSASGRVPLLIEGDDGTRLHKGELAAALAHTEHAVEPAGDHR